MMKKIAHFGLPIILGVLCIWACSKDEDPAPKPTPDKENTAPTIEAQSVSVAEDKLPGQIGKINASDDDGDTLNFEISGESPFNLAKTGELSLAVGQTLNFEQTPKYDLTVIVNDGTLSASATITVNVTNVDEAPELTNETTEFSVEENIADDFVIATLTADDPEGGNVNFEIVGDNTLFEIDELGQLSLIQGQNLNFEDLDPENPVHNITVRLSDDTNQIEYTINVQVQKVNEAPEVANQFNFEVAESINHVVNFGLIDAIDPNNDNLTFEVLGNNTLFEIDNNGNLSLIEGQSLDFEDIPNHQIIILVSDGELSSETQVDITVTNSFADLDTPFITTWETTGANEEIIFGINSNNAYNFDIDWGDGSIENVSFNAQSNFSHNYETPGLYTVAIEGQFPAIRINNGPSADKLKSIEQWGNNQWLSMERAFYECNTMFYNATDVPDLSQVENAAYMFFRCNQFNGNLAGWDTQNISNMEAMFAGSVNFNGDGLANWNTQNVSNMNGMFNTCTTFNMDLGTWDISKVTSMNTIFRNSGMSEENYSYTIMGWATLNQGEAQIPLNVDFTGQFGMKYCNQALQARSDLEALGWQISGDSASGNDCP
ncbi:BspA family leucine-rich repeat surface protein [Allomuricauda sp. NBRC 101325]|uniref:BspA family leucine-rich repeat surface protein n=1 Tax=Allomuricauda sp. NBRC 101325 TaxID=1113758 RepID=UPI0024A0EF55|nr:BspA family leucine-rich repeat surface protein [Muricauda sp. NBRC 101325]GLU44711.1 hypothetical protein Musp01_23350 [Muricauda sp. NBRC 101325]